MAAKQGAQPSKVQISRLGDRYPTRPKDIHLENLENCE